MEMNGEENPQAFILALGAIVERGEKRERALGVFASPVKEKSHQERSLSFRFALVPEKGRDPDGVGFEIRLLRMEILWDKKSGEKKKKKSLTVQDQLGVKSFGRFPIPK